MQDRLLFVISPPRAGSTLLQRMLGSHSAVYTHPEPHIITPLAHLGFYKNVDKAPFDHINAAEAIREYVGHLPGGEQDYLDACRAYTDVLYGRLLDRQDGKKMMLDKTPAYGLVLPFLAKLYPQAHYIVLTRHPLAVLSSYAESFFEGDFDAAVAFNDVLNRYVPAMADFLRDKPVPIHHIRYEDMVKEPEQRMAEIFAFLGLPNEEGVVEYGKHQHEQGSYGDPKVKHETRPTTKSVSRWAVELANDPHKLELAQKVVSTLDPEDVKIWGYDKAKLFDKVGEAQGQEAPPKNKKWKLDSYRLKRKVFMSLRKDIHHNQLGRALRRVKYYCDVLLRE